MEGKKNETIKQLKEKVRELEKLNSANRSVVDTAVDGIISINEKGYIQAFNRSAERLFGYQADEVIGKKVNMLMPDPMRSEHDGYLNNYMTTGVKKIIGFGREVTGQRKDGTTFPLHLSVGESVGENERCFIAILRDISELKASMNALKESETKLRAIFDTAVDGFITIDEQANIQSFNKAAEGLFGYSAEEVTGKNVKMLMPEPFHGEHDGYLKNYFSTGEKKVIGKGREVVGKRKNGSTFPMHLSIGEAKLVNGRVFTGIVRDISQFRQSQQELEQKTKKLEEQDWMKTQRTKFSSLSLGAESLQGLAQTAITEMASMVEAGYGVFYIKQQDLESEGPAVFTLLGSYAYMERKHNNNRILMGEGLIGQCALEQRSILLTQVPGDYVHISSGLGEASPLNVLAVPLVFEDQVVGVIELASFHRFNELQRLLIDQVAVDLANGINNMLGQQKTQELLKQAQSMAGQMQAQQEELRASNEALEQQTQALTQSQGQLKEQSEELKAINEELEEKSQRLEAQRAAIEEKNKVLQTNEAELKGKAKELEMSSKYKSEFLANMSHELRTPLNSLLVLSDYLLGNNPHNLNKDQVDSIEVIKKSGLDLLNLINDILDLSKVEAGKMSANMADISIDSILSNLKSQFIPIAHKNKVEFIIKKQPDLPSFIKTDEQRVQQVLKNLLSNAFKFTENGSVTLSLTRNNVNKTIRFAVIDTGIGIPADKKEFVFEAFKQIDGSISRKYNGTGLGLAISAQLAKVLHGKIELQTEEGRGSTFTLILPEKAQDSGYLHDGSVVETPGSDVFKSAHGTDQSVVFSSAQNSGMQGKNDVSLETPREPTLLIIDDLDFGRKLKKIGKSKGFKCVLLDKGMDGIKYAIENSPEAIILGLSLPDINGLKILKELKANPKTSLIPVHITSCKDESTLTLKYGALGHLLKPANESSIEKVFSDIENVLKNPIKTVLLIEDKETSQKTVMKLIGNNVTKVEVAETCHKALKLLKSKQYNCIILDLKLPDMSGIDFLKQLNDSKQHYKLAPVIVYTGKDLTREEYIEISQYAADIVLKVSNSPQRLLDEVSLFLHSMHRDLSPEQIGHLKRRQIQNDFLKNKSILLVDDDVRNIYALSTALKSHGLNVATASSGLKALEKLEDPKNHFDLIVMDIMMPEMDGYEATKCIRANPKWANIPVLAVTAKAMPEDNAKCLAAGASDYLAKPVDIHYLVSMIGVWIERGSEGARQASS